MNAHQLAILLAIFQIERAFVDIPFVMDKMDLFSEESLERKNTEASIENGLLATNINEE